MPAYTSPAYLIGKSCTSATVAGYIATLSAGVKTLTVDGTSLANISTGGVMDVYELERARSLAQIQPINAYVDNFVPITSGFTATLNEIRRSDGTSALENIANSYDHIGFTVKITEPGASAATYVATMLAVIESCRSGLDAEKNLTTMALRPCGFGVVIGTASTVTSPY